MIYVRSEWRTRAKCCFCESVCFVHSCTDGHLRCDSCANSLVLQGLAKYGSFCTVSIPHVCELEYK